MPMAAITLSLVIGIVVGSVWSVHWVLWLLLLSVAAISTVRFSYMGLVATAALGALLFQVRSVDNLPVNQRAEMVLKVADDGIDYGAFHTYTAKILQYNGDKSRALVRVTTDSLFTPQRGDIIKAVSHIRPFTPQNSSYAESMQRRGYVGRVTVGQSGVVEYQPAERQSLHLWAVKRLRSLMNDTEHSGVAISMSLGSRVSSSAQIKEVYSLSGTSHLLAVSGLHVGIVYMLLSLLLLPFVLLWRGNTIRALVIVALIWGYVALCGYPISAVRAAIMFSVMQLSYLSSNSYTSANAISLTAFVMLIADPYLIFDLSFRLSFVAVMAIIFICRPLMAALHTKRGLLNMLVETMVISIVCTAATMPIVSNSFGVVSLISILVNPLVLITAQIVIILSLSALVMPSAAAVAAANGAEWCCKVQNMLIEGCVNSGIGYAEVRLSDGVVAAIYGVAVVIVIILFGVKYKEAPGLKKNY